MRKCQNFTHHMHSREGEKSDSKYERIISVFRPKLQLKYDPARGVHMKPSACGVCFIGREVVITKYMWLLRD